MRSRRATCSARSRRGRGARRRQSSFLLVASFAALFVVVGKRHGDHLALDRDARPYRSTLTAYTPDFTSQLVSASLTATLLSYAQWAFTLDVGEGASVGRLSVLPFTVGMLGPPSSWFGATAPTPSASSRTPGSGRGRHGAFARRRAVPVVSARWSSCLLSGWGGATPSAATVDGPHTNSHVRKRSSGTRPHGGLLMAGVAAVDSYGDRGAERGWSHRRRPSEGVSQIGRPSTKATGTDHGRRRGQRWTPCSGASCLRGGCFPWCRARSTSPSAAPSRRMCTARTTAPPVRSRALWRPSAS